MTSKPPLSEEHFQNRVIETAKCFGWRCVHFRPARTTTGWRTALQGDVGFTDLVLARKGVVICAEIKSNTGRLRPEQKAWLHALGPNGRVWRPRDWDSIITELSTGKRATA